MIEQVICNAMVAAARYFMVAAGLLVIFRAVRFFDLGLGALFTFCAYATLTLREFCRLPFVPSVVLAILATVLVAVCIYTSVYASLWHKRASRHVLLLASLGVYVVIANVISLLWGDSTITMKSARGGSFELLGARIASDQIATILAALFMWGTLHALLKHTRWGKGLRAIGNDAELAEVSGVRSKTVILLAYVAGAVMVGMAGVSVAVGINMTPGMGISALLTGVVVLIIGGAKRVAGIAVAAVLVAGIQHLVTWHIGPQWQDAVAFAMLLAFLLLKPEGFMGKPAKTSTT